MLESKENAIEFLYGDKTATCTFCSPKFVNKIKKYSENREDCKIVAENKDGSIVCHVPVKWIKVSPPRQVNREYTEEEKLEVAKRLKEYRERKKGEKK